MADFIGSISLFAGVNLPDDYMYCEGQLLPIYQYQALFSVLRFTYGGDGVGVFNLPDLRGRVPIGAGQSSASKATYKPGDTGGEETTGLTIDNIPSHTHLAQLNVTTANATEPVAKPTSIIASPGTGSGRQFNASLGYTEGTPNVSLNESTVAVEATGNDAPVNIMQPYQTLSYIIRINGTFPPGHKDQ